MSAKPSLFIGNVLMLITAALWGFTFVAQKSGMDHLGPLMFSAIRFAIGATCLLFLLHFLGGKRLNQQGWVLGLLMGVMITLGISFQQIGIVYTTAGKAGFITAVYILFVPIFLSFLGKRLKFQIWPAALLALLGLYFLSIKGNEFDSINKGDYWVLASSVFWAIHIILVEKAVESHDPLRLSIVQFFTCSLLSLLAAFIFEPIVLADIIEGTKNSVWELVYGGIASVAIAFTLQVFAQQSVPSHHAALIMSLEAVFAVVGGIWLLNEILTQRMLWGFVLMFAGLILAQYKFKSKGLEQNS